jgi:predicted alpha/beta hydrolase family esterase
MKTQILFIHGGMTFKRHNDYLNYLKTREISLAEKKRWVDDYYKSPLKNKFELIRPHMPRSENAHYNEWAIHFARYIPLLKNNCILIGSSLGGMFLAKYLSENKFPKKLKAVFLICPPFDNSLSNEDLTNRFKLKNDLSLIEKNCKNLYLLFSEDDNVVPLPHAEKYRRKLPAADIRIYKNKNGHFQISKFPELIKLISSL